MTPLEKIVDGAACLAVIWACEQSEAMLRLADPALEQRVKAQEL